MTRTMEQPREVAFTWRVHAGLESVAARADAKAGILLAHQGGALVLALSAWQMGGSPAMALATALVVAAMGAAIGVVVPVLRPKGRLAVVDDLVYFGHLREWAPPSLAERISGLSQDDEIAMVTR